jgi:sulfur carrier protein ThiS
VNFELEKEAAVYYHKYVAEQDKVVVVRAISGA